MIDRKVELAIFTGNRCMIPLVTDDITLEWERQGSPGKLEFTVVKDEHLSFPEGAVVRLTVDDKVIFKGFVFEKSRDREQHISVLAYDQLRYFKNSDTFVVENQTASDFLRFIAKQFFLKTGEIEDTGFVIEQQILDNKTLFDAVQDLLDLTLINTGRLFVLYDDGGKICLKEVESLKSNLLLCNETVENFDYTSSIEEMVNTVKYTRSNETNTQTQDEDVLLAYDEESIAKYGVLQHIETGTFSENTDFATVAKQILELNNRVQRKLSISGALGDTSIRGGSSVFIDMHLGDQIVRWRAMVERVTHIFENGHHYMDLDVSGKGLR